MECALELKPYEQAYAGIVGNAEYLDIQRPREDIFFYESSRFLKDIQAILEEHPHSEETHSKNLRIMELQKAFDECSATFKWGRILHHMNDRLGAVTVSAWFDQATIKEFTWDWLVIYAGSDFRREIIQRRCMDYIRGALAELYGCNAEVSILSQADSAE